MTARFDALVLTPGALASRPAADSVGVGALYPTTDDGKVYRSNGATWDEWATLGVEPTGTITKIHGPITQAAYDALTPDADTLYVIVG